MLSKGNEIYSQIQQIVSVTYSTEVENSMFNDRTGKHGQNNCLQEPLNSSSVYRMNHRILTVVDTYKRSFLWGALFILRCFFCALVFKDFKPILAAVYFLIKLRSVFDILLNAIIVTIKLDNQMMIHRLPAIARD